MANDFLDDFKISKKKPRYQTVQEAFSVLVEKERQKKIKLEASKKFNKLKALQRLQSQPIQESISQVIEQQAQAQKRQGIIKSIGSKAEAIERQVVSINEVPFLRNLESSRQKILSPPDRWLEDVERSVTNSFPD